MDLLHDGNGTGRCDRSEQVMPHRQGQDHHVVGRRPEPGTRGCDDRLEQRVGLRKIDDAVDSKMLRRGAGPPDLDDGPRDGVQIGRGLLRQQHALCRAH